MCEVIYCEVVISYDSFRRLPPPLFRYEYFFALLRDFPDLKFTINGGINSVVESLAHFGTCSGITRQQLED
ncbi:unnamed protein product [Eruca vesicaria subsp. sativa]|uniref:Uncharacterized protein n=1 Tax=Eruca vesicaria subsp. sativa TaxID=29727 RepID=A0ABC8JA91_ERUVS|nr:unnamed protein product [Eruca vesicaria subsp. sativa]